MQAGVWASYMGKLPVFLLCPPAFARDIHHVLEVVHDLLPVAAPTHMGRNLCPIEAIQADALPDPLLLIVCEGPSALRQLL